MTRFLTMGIHLQFTTGIINLEIGFPTIPCANIMDYEYHIPKTHKLFHNQNILQQYEKIPNHGYSPPLYHGYY